MRTGLGMRKGEMIAQGAHASMKVFFHLNEGAPESLSVPLTPPMQEWVNVPLNLNGGLSWSVGTPPATQTAAAPLKAKHGVHVSVPLTWLEPRTLRSRS